MESLERLSLKNDFYAYYGGKKIENIFSSRTAAPILIKKYILWDLMLQFYEKIMIFFFPKIRVENSFKLFLNSFL